MTGYVGEKTPDRLSPAWWDLQQARAERHPLPRIYIIYNDHQLGWLYNKGKRFSDSAFKEYVYNLAIVQGCQTVRFIYGITLHQKKVIRYAVIYF